MGRNVVVIASGETERRALPHLFAALTEVALLEVRVPPRGNGLTLENAEKLIKASWFASLPPRPDKFVVLLDIDGKEPSDVVAALESKLPERLRNIPAAIRVAYAQQHLEAWFFADENGLRNYLGRNLGNVNCKEPDRIENPKLHLKHLLKERAYTAPISEEIAKALSPKIVAENSPSYRRFIDTVHNGGQH